MKVTHRGQASTTTRVKPSYGNEVYTPDWLADIMVEWLDIEPGMRILDPCVGRGNLLIALQFKGYVEGYELNPNCSYVNKNIHIGKDFLLAPHPKHKFDRIIINPPFSKSGAWKFLHKCFEHWLKPDGKLVTVLPNYTVDNAEGRKPWLSKYMRRIGNIPKNTFEPAVPVLHGVIAMFDRSGSDCRYEFVKPRDNQVEM